MKTIMNREDLKTIEQLTDFLSATHVAAFWWSAGKMAVIAGFREFFSDNR